MKAQKLNDAKKSLATEITTLCHGEKAAIEAAETARKTFEEGGTGDDLPSIDVAQTDLEAGIPAFELLCQAGLAKSKGEARRLIRSGGGRINDVAIKDETQMVGVADVSTEGLIKLSAGKKRHALVRPVA